MPLPPGLTYDDAAALGQQVGLPIPLAPSPPAGPRRRFRVSPEGRLGGLEEEQIDPQTGRTDWVVVPPPSEKQSAQGPPLPGGYTFGSQGTQGPPEWGESERPNPDIPAPLSTPQPRGGLSFLGIPSGPAADKAAEEGRAFLRGEVPTRPAPPASPPGVPAPAQPVAPMPAAPRPSAEEALGQLTEDNPWMGWKKREGLQMDLGRALGLPIPTAEGSAADAKAKEQADFAARKAKLMGAPAGQGVVPSLDQLREYAQLGLEETQPPGFMSPQGFIQTLYGVTPGPTFKTYGDDYYKSFVQGSPQEQEVSRQAAGRQALLASLHALPEMTKLQEAQLHVQAQREAAGHAMMERAIAATLDKSPEEQLATLKSLRAGQQLSTSMAPGVPGATVPPGVSTSTPPPAEQRFLEQQRENQRVLAGAPSKQIKDQVLARISSLNDVEALVNELGGDVTTLRHGPTRAEIVKSILNQGAKAPKRLVPALEEALMRHADLGSLATRDWNPVEGVPVRAYQDVGTYHKQVDSPFGGVKGERYANFVVGPLARLLTGQGPLVEPVSKEQVAGHVGKARAAALLLRALHESGYQP